MAQTKALLVLLLAVLSAEAPIVGGYTATARIGLLAVSETDGGVVVPAEVSARIPGSGAVELYPLGLLKSDTIRSTVVAAYLASVAAGLSPYTIDYRVSFESREELGGTSGSAALAAVFTALARGNMPRPNTTITGFLSPLGIVLPVQGVSAKLEAALREGYTLVGIPAGLRGVEAPPGLRVEPLCTLTDAYALITNGVLPPRLPVLDSIDRRGFEEAFRDDALLLYRAAMRLNVSGDWARLYDEAMRRGDYYSAASLAFSAIARSNTTLEETLRVLGYESLQDALRDALDHVVKARSRVSQPSIDLYAFIALSEAEYRLYLAERLAENTNNTILAVMRALTAISWADAAEPGQGPYMQAEIVDEAVDTILDYAEQVLLYAQALLGETHPAPGIRMIDGRSPRDWLNDARHAAAMGLNARAYSLALAVIRHIDSTVFASIAAGVAGTAKTQECLERAAQQYAASLAETPTLLEPYASLYHYTEAYIGDNITKIVLLDNTVSGLLGLLFIKAWAGQQQAQPAEESAAPYAAVAAATAATAALALAAAALARKEVEERLRLLTTP